jgi:surfeit locus 1 family protein
MAAPVQPLPASPGRFPWLLILVSLVAGTILIALGTWQMNRLAWKEGLLATIDSRVHAEPVPLGAVLADGRSINDQEYTRVMLAGVYDHAYERHFFATFDGQSGFYVYTPLRLTSGDTIFVNRGFVPYDRKDPATRPEGQVAGQVTVTGLVRPGLVEKPSLLVPDNDTASNIFYWKDIRAMRDTSGLPASESVLGFFVDADDAPNPGGLPRGGVTIIDLPNSHLQYALTWYGLAAALAVVVAGMLWRRYHPARPEPLA